MDTSERRSRYNIGLYTQNRIVSSSANNVCSTAHQKRDKELEARIKTIRS